MLKEVVVLIAKGFAMGTANIIPGVSGGTIALITGIYERLITSIKSFDMAAIRLLLKLRWSEFAARTDLYFLLALLAGVAVGVLTLARILERYLVSHETYVMAIFFGLIAMSVYSVGRVIDRYSASVITWLVIGTAIAAGIAFISPATENSSFLYLVICGVAAICSMILPGLSGSFILIVMGNYLLVLEAINDIDISILAPLALGCVVGIVVFSRLLAYVFDKYHDETVAAMTGFILGSLVIIWPWKERQPLRADDGSIIMDRHGEPLVGGYDWSFPDLASLETIVAIALIVAGAAVIFAIDWFGSARKSS